MKPKTQKLVDTPEEYKTEKPSKTVEKSKPKAQPVKRKTVYRVKCIWNGSVKVLGEQTPSGKTYRFEPGQVQAVESKEDFDYLLTLGRNAAGCCSGSGTPRKYFEIA